MAKYQSPELKSLFKIERHHYPVPVDVNIPDVCKKTVLLPACDYDGVQYLYYIDLDKSLVIVWNVDISLYISHVINQFSQFDLNTKELYGRFALHTSFVYHNRIYALPAYGNFILCFDIDSNEYEIIYDSMEHIYSFTNGAVNDNIYFTRWTIFDYFKRKSTEEDVQLDIGYYNIRSGEFCVIKSILGPESIHQTVLSPKGDKIIAVEVPRYEKNVEANKNITVSRALQESRILSYDLFKNKLHMISSDNGPAHITFDINDPDIGHIACCNFSPLGCFGTARIDKYDFENGIVKIGTYEEEDFYRIPNHEIFEYDGENLLATPVYSNQVRLINTSTMKCRKKIYLSDKHITLEKGKVPFYYPFTDRTPYTVLPVNNTRYIVMCSIRSIDILDFLEDKIIAKIEYNKQYNPLSSINPLRASGHSSFA